MRGNFQVRDEQDPSIDVRAPLEGIDRCRCQGRPDGERTCALREACADNRRVDRICDLRCAGFPVPQRQARKQQDCDEETKINTVEGGPELSKNVCDRRDNDFSKELKTEQIALVQVWKTCGEVQDAGGRAEHDVV